MNHPWGISGPGFLWLYGVALVAAVGLAVYLRWRLRHPRLAEPVPPGDASMVAYLVDGAERVVEASIARLVDQRAVRVTRSGMVTRIIRTVPDPLDQAVLDQLGGRTRPVHDLVQRSLGVPQIDEVAEAVVRQRLRYGMAGRRRARRPGLAALYLLLVIGVARFINGVVGEYPVGYLALEIAVTGIVIGVLHASGRREYKFHTVHGERVIAAAAGSDETAVRVALHGLTAYPDRAIAVALRSTRNVPQPSRREVRAGAGATVSSGGCGSSSGSSSGGGSGCGGCGGGGS